jgi:nucleoid-associated protein YgaU
MGPDRDGRPAGRVVVGRVEVVARVNASVDTDGPRRESRPIHARDVTLQRMTTNGRLPASDLATVAVGVRLITGAANAYRALVAQGSHEHVAIKPAPGVGSGYRDLELQELFYRASRGDRAAIEQVHFNTSSTTKVAAPGGSSHGWGDRIDLLFDGSQTPDAADLNLAKRFGFTREFGSADSNHFEHDGKTAIHPPTVHEFYVVRGGDTLTDIAEDHRTTLEKLKTLNPAITNPDLIHVGQRVRIR